MAALAMTAVSGCAAEDGVIDTEAGKIKYETVAKGLAHPWGLAFLPDASFLVTERPGRLRLVSKTGEVSKPLTGVPEVFAEGQGGLLDVALDPDFASNRLVYLSYSEPGEGGAGTAVARGKLADGGLENLEVIFRQEPKVGGQPFRLAARLRAGRQAVHHPRRALHVHPRPGSFQRSRQDCANQPGRIGARRQPLRGAEGGATGNLVLWPSQPAGRGHQPIERQTVGERVRPLGRRRTQHPAGGAQLRLAGGELGQAL